ncbi:AraC family transcriptional regulator [Bosea sp. Leaf344]|uniref:AraC family transcriptional regulator n=1 Tax=Bosea sp. Leaf344 TaxID=1736346 RepID=UPI000A5A3936|nr:AraC family transcriptional regulator [Bosea sp. Leaf344]
MKISLNLYNRLAPLDKHCIKEILANEFAERGLDIASSLQSGGSVDRTYTESPARHLTLHPSALLQAAADVAECPHLGLKLGQRMAQTSLHDPGQAWWRTPTLGDALGNLHGCVWMDGCGGTLDIQPGDPTTLRFIVLDPDLESAAAISDMVVAYLIGVLRALCGLRWSPEMVELPRRPPRDQQPYRQLFQCRVGFNAVVATIHVRADDLRRELVPPGMLASMAEVPAARELPDPVTRIRSYLGSGLSTGTLRSARQIARHFGVGGRSLQRDLAKARTSCRELANELRIGMCKRLLSDTELPITEIAFALGYADISVLTRAFTRSVGICPSTWRSRPARAGSAIPLHNAVQVAGRPARAGSAPGRSLREAARSAPRGEARTSKPSQPPPSATETQIVPSRTLSFAEETGF